MIEKVELFNPPMVLAGSPLRRRCSGPLDYSTLQWFCSFFFRVIQLYNGFACFSFELSNTTMVLHVFLLNYSTLQGFRSEMVQNHHRVEQCRGRNNIKAAKTQIAKISIIPACFFYDSQMQLRLCSVRASKIIANKRQSRSSASFRSSLVRLALPQNAESQNGGRRCLAARRRQ